jgi:predicted permease
VALYQGGVGFNLSTGGEAARFGGARTSASFFSTLGIAPLLGRTFLPDEETPGGDRVVVLSHALWRQRFGGDANIIGRDLQIDGEPRTVVGVMPPAFRFPDRGTQLWVPHEFDRGNTSALWGEGRRGGWPVARLGPGAAPAQVLAELHALAPALRVANTLWQYPPDYRADAQVVPLQERLVSDVRTRLLVLLGAVGFVLLIACANVANLLLARASGRQREVGVRQALGASRGRIVRQLLTESAVLGLAGGAFGLLLAFAGVRALVGGLPTDIPRTEEIGVDRWVLGFTFVASVLTGLVFGAIPALRASRPDAQASLKIEGRGSSASLGRAAALLVVGEVAVAVLLVTGAGLLIRSFAELVAVDPGFRTGQVGTARVTPPENRYGDADGCEPSTSRCWRAAERFPVRRRSRRRVNCRCLGTRAGSRSRARTIRPCQDSPRRRRAIAG